jgi:hypothetical protein
MQKINRKITMFEMIDTLKLLKTKLTDHNEILALKWAIQICESNIELIKAMKEKAERLV